MNRLQKKCVLGTTGIHLLLLVILFVGPAFFVERERPDTSPVLEIIPDSLVDAATTGVKEAQPPPPAPATVKVEPPPPIQKPEPQVVTPPAPVPPPKLEKVEVVEPVKEPVKPATKADLTPVVKPSVTKKPDRKILLVPTTRSAPNHPKTPPKAAPDNSAAVKSALQALRKNLSSETAIAPVGNSSVAAANYAATVKAIYERAWTPPNDTASDDANIKVRVTIASDGNVISARIIEPSGDSSVDGSVRYTLDRVQFIAPFPSGTSDKERTYIINFNLKSKRLNG